MKRIIMLVLFVFLFLVCGCSNESSQGTNYAGIYQVYYVTSEKIADENLYYQIWNGIMLGYISENDKTPKIDYDDIREGVEKSTNLEPILRDKYGVKYLTYMKYKDMGDDYLFIDLSSEGCYIKYFSGKLIFLRQESGSTDYVLYFKRVKKI